MSRRIRYTDEPLGQLKVIRDFLPPPEELAFREEGVKVTIALSKRSVEFFKREAQRHGTQYQRMIRRLLDSYTQVHSRPLTKRSSRPLRTRQGRERVRSNPVPGRRTT
jgi:hypothetical protein